MMEVEDPALAEEAEDAEDEVAEDGAEEVAEPIPDVCPETAPKKRQNLKERAACPQCGKVVSLYTLKYSHKCKEKKPEPVQPEPDQPERKRRCA